MWALPAAALAAQDQGIVRDLQASVRSHQPVRSAEQLSRMAALSGFALLIKPGIRNPQAVTDALESCYLDAARSSQVRNIMACYVMDRKVTDQVDRTLRTHTARQTQERFEAVMSGLGIKDPVKQRMHKEFEVQWNSAKRWLETRTVDQVQKCLRGVRSHGCAI